MTYGAESSRASSLGKEQVFLTAEGLLLLNSFSAALFGNERKARRCLNTLHVLLNSSPGSVEQRNRAKTMKSAVQLTLNTNSAELPTAGHPIRSYLKGGSTCL